MGVLIAFSVLFTWIGHLLYSLNYIDPNPLRFDFWAHFFIQTWLFTGLFITSHDAMHGTVSKYKKLNYLMGFTTTMLYAGMWYPKLIDKHKLHHLYPATGDDPDYNIKNQNFFAWWFKFMKTYLTFWQILVMALFFNVGLLFFSELQLIVFWVLPAILSTFQLFYFGTYVPHKLPHTPAMGINKARTQKKNHLWAFLSCYFFGYHFEHHLSPHTPWWKLYKLK